MTTPAPLDLGEPTGLHIERWSAAPEPSDAAGSNDSDSSPRASPVAPRTTGTKRGAEDDGACTLTSRPRAGARHSRQQTSAVDEDASSSPTASVSGSALPSPDATMASDNPFAAASAPSPERKIWMRACNSCGVELHVRRVRCTACGTVQMSKRAYAAQQEEKLRADELGEDPASASAGSSPASSPSKPTRVAKDAQAAASQLALIAEAPSSATSPAPAADAPGAGGREAALAEAATAAGAPAALPPAASPAPSSSSSVVSRLARLTPEQLTKLRRMQKLRALLAKLPPGVTLPPPQTVAAAPPTAPEGESAAADAISMLASVACM